MPNEKDWWGRRLVDSLEVMRDKKDRGALATLRRALQREPGRDAGIFRYVVPYLPAERGWTETAAFLVASLFAAHSDPGGRGTLGAAFKKLAANKPNPESVERRFVALLNADAEDLHHHLRHAVSLLRANDVRVDWERLLRDLLNWGHPEGYVQRNWARGFWEYTPQEKKIEETDNANAAT